MRQLYGLQLAAIIEEATTKNIILGGEVSAIKRDIGFIGGRDERISEVEMSEFSLDRCGNVLDATELTDEHHVVAIDIAIHLEFGDLIPRIGFNHQQLLLQGAGHFDRHLKIVLGKCHEGEWENGTYRDNSVQWKVYHIY